MSLGLRLAESAQVPDLAIRAGIRSLLRKRLRQAREMDHPAFLRSMQEGPVALATDAANEQHYEVPAAFYEHMLGPHRKYSACLWEPDDSLTEAEARMLALTCERAEIEDGMDVLELGCGWGSLSLWMAEAYPNSRITAVSNSASQKAFIEEAAQFRGLGNLVVVRADMNDFHTEQTFDRVVSVEMFEHMRNYRELLSRVNSWLKSEGKLFVHIFCHRELAYPFEVEGEDDWMAKYFFTGGIMPSFGLFDFFQDALTVERSWSVNGEHYARTLEAWLERMDANKAAIKPILAATYGAGHERIWFQRWRIFLMACSELFGYAGGQEWFVGHYRLVKS